MRIKDLPLLNVPRFPIEAGHVMMFARAIGDPNPIYEDAEYAAKSPLGRIIAPPTFTEAGLHYDANFRFRPKVGVPWFGSGREPCSVPQSKDEGGGTDLHAETHFEYHSVLGVGDVLFGNTRRGNTWQKEGKRSGKLSFRESITEFRNAAGELVTTARTVGVSTERKVEQQAPPLPAGGVVAERPATYPARYPVRALRAGELKVGDTHESVVVDNLRRGQIIQYAGASGDCSPQHTDEIFNTKVAGYPSVFAHGMLGMAMLGRMLTDWVGDGRLTRFGARFVTQSWPGDTVTARATVRKLSEERGEPLVELDLESVNQHGRPILTGYATARLQR